jgi:hypothetical protein
MLNQVKALTWEYIRVCAWGSIAVFVLLMMGPVIFNYIFDPRNADFVFAKDHPIRFFISFQCIAALAYALPHGLAAEQIPQRLRLIPLSNRYLVTFLMAITAASVVFFSIVTQWSFYLICGVRWPVLTTALSLGVLSSLVLSGMWWIREFRIYRLLIFGVSVTGWVYWLTRHFDRAHFRAPDQLWHTISVVDSIVLLTTVVVSWFVMLRAFAQYRRGEFRGSWLFAQVSIPEVTAFLTESRSVNINVSVSAGSPREAFSAMNWDTNRRLLTLIVSVIAVFAAVWGVFIFRSAAGCGLEELAGMLILFSAVSGMLTGQNLWATKTYEMRAFTSTLPVSDADFGLALVLGWLKTSVINWGCVLLIFLTLMLLYVGISGVENLHREYSDLWLVEKIGAWAIPSLICGTLALNWISTGLMGAIVTTGRIAFVTTSWISLQFSITAIMILAGLGRDGYQWAGQIADVLSLGLSALMGGIGTFAMFTLARRRNLITRWQTISALLTVLILSAVLLATLPVSPVWKIVWCCAACLVVAPVAAIPCALQWNRHR